MTDTASRAPAAFRSRRIPETGPCAEVLTHPQRAGLCGHHSKRNRRSELCQDRRPRAMDHDSRRRPQEPGAALLAWRARRCDQSLGARRFSQLAEVFHRRPMGSTGRRKNLRTKRSGGRLHHHDRADGSGWRRAYGTVIEEVAEGQNRSRRAFLGLRPGSFHGEGAARTFLCIRGYWSGSHTQPSLSGLPAKAIIGPLRN